MSKAIPGMVTRAALAESPSNRFCSRIFNDLPILALAVLPEGVKLRLTVLVLVIGAYPGVEDDSHISSYGEDCPVRVPKGDA